MTGKNVTLTPLDLDYIEFLSQRRGIEQDIVRAQYATVKARFGFAGPKFRKVMVQIHDLFSPVYGDDSEEELIVSLQFHAALHLYRHISYRYHNPARYQKVAQRIVTQATGPLVIVDYGAGLGHLSMAITEVRPASRVYLLDVEGMVLDFAAFRFGRQGVDFEIIRATQECVYPELPKHNVCLITEVWEHLKRPLVAYENICRSLVDRGWLITSASDRGKEFFHVSPDLQGVRARLAEDFDPVAKGIFRKRK